ncbi:MAG: hypothetical protein NUV93_01180 [Firmicutes bacterium]|nr:hypothetical protein [Bacillota bacterium]
MSRAVQLDIAGHVTRPATRVPTFGWAIRKGRRLQILLLALVTVVSTPAVRFSAARDPGTPWGQDAEAADFSPAVLVETRWLMSSIHSSGALALTPEKEIVVPYFSNIAMLTLLDIAPPLAGSYIDWYLDNINRPDRWGLPGTIYDFRIRGDELIPTYDYDSADAYAATFLTLVSEYYRKTGDIEFVRRRRPRIDMVAGVLTSLQDGDGLVRVKPRDSNKYLMDNCEDFKGLVDWAYVLDALGDGESAARCRAAAARIAAAVEYRLWDEKASCYAWRIDRANLASKPSWRKWYPDAVAQLYPALSGLISPSSMRARVLYDKFNRAFPYWPDVRMRHGYPWGLVARYAMTQGDKGRAMEFLGSAGSRFVETGGPHPWYCLESAMFIETCKAAGHRGSPGTGATAAAPAAGM